VRASYGEFYAADAGRVLVDFLPALPLVEIDDGGLEFLLETYRAISSTVEEGQARSFLVDVTTGQIDKQMLKKIIAAVTRREQAQYLSKLAPAAATPDDATTTATTTTTTSSDDASLASSDATPTVSEEPQAEEVDQVEQAIRAVVEKKKLQHSAAQTAPSGKGPSLMHLIRPMQETAASNSSATQNLKQLLSIDEQDAPASSEASPAPVERVSTKDAVKEAIAAAANEPLVAEDNAKAREIHYETKAHLPTFESPTGFTQVNEELLKKVVFNYIEGYVVSDCYCSKATASNVVWCGVVFGYKFGMGIAILLPRRSFMELVLPIPFLATVGRCICVH
jgi:5'-3' exonuclease